MDIGTQIRIVTTEPLDLPAAAPAPEPAEAPARQPVGATDRVS